MGTKSVKGRKVGTRSKRGARDCQEGVQENARGAASLVHEAGCGRAQVLGSSRGIWVETDQIPEYNVGLPDALTMGRLQS